MIYKIKLWTVPRATPNADSVMSEHEVSAEIYEAMKASGRWAEYVEPIESLVSADRFVCKIDMLPPVQS